MGNAKNRRRHFIVNEPLQRRLLLTSMWVPCLFLCGISICLGVYCMQLHDDALMADVEISGVIPIFVLCSAFVVGAALFTIMHGVRISHRIAGPVVNFRMTIDRFKAGDRKVRIKLRKADLLAEAGEKINELLDWTEAQLPPETTEVKHADDALEDVETVASVGSAVES